MELFLVAAVLGILPAAIAHRKGYSFGLWWLFGAALFIVALPWAIVIKKNEEALARRGGLRQCPQCAEYIKQEAQVCRFCRAQLPKDAEHQESSATESAGWSAGKRALVVGASIIVVVLALFFGIGLYTYSKMGSPATKKQESVASGTNGITKGNVGDMYTMPAVVTRLAGNQKRYAKMQIALQLTTAGIKVVDERREERLREVATAKLSALTFAQVNSTDGKLRLREALLAEAKGIFGEGNVKEIYFTELVVQ